MPQDLAAIARRAAQDPELEGMRQAVAIGDIRIRELCGQLTDGTGNWSKAEAALAKLRRSGDDLNMARAALTELEDTIHNGRTLEQTWKELRELFQERDKLLTGETQRHKITADLIQADKVAAMMVAMCDALRAESQDRALLARVSERWERIMSQVGATDSKH